MSTSYNGWPASEFGDGIDRDFTAAGVTFPGGVRAGAVATVFGWLIERLATIEAPAAGWNWGWEYRDDVNDPGTLSCHASGTAIDYNAPNHPNGGDAYGGWSDDQVTAIRGWLDELGGVVYWGADFTGTKDPMHFEISGTAEEVQAVADRLGTTNPPEGDWFDMATKEDLQAVVAAELDNRGLTAAGIRDVTANVLRADEFKLTADQRGQDVFREVTDVLHSDEFNLGAQRQDVAAIKAKLGA